MSTETVINIERRNAGRRNWSTFHPSLSDTERVQELLTSYREHYPEHHFRAVKITTTRETLSKLKAKH